MKAAGLLRLTRRALFLTDQVFRGVAGSAPLMRLLDLMSREEPAPAHASPPRRAGVPDLGYRPVAHAGRAVPVQAPRGIQAWDVEWKPPRQGAADGLGYLGTGGFYLSQEQTGSPRPGVLVLPILHDRLSLAAGSLARSLARQGFATLEMRTGPSFLDRVHVTPDGPGPTWQDVVVEMILDGRRALDWLSARSEVDQTRLGLVGVSHGAIVGSCLLGADPRLRAGVLCMGGADEALIVARSREPSVRRFRQRFLEARGLSEPEALRRFTDKHRSPTEPLRYAPAVDPRTVLLFKTRLDRFVVPEAQDKLWEALGQPRRISLPLGHLGFGLAFYYAARRAAEFLRERLASSA